MAAINALRSQAGKYLDDALRGIQRSPVEVIATLCIAITFSWAIELGDEAFQNWAEVAVSCALVLVVAWTGTFLNAMGIWSAAQRWAFTVGGVLMILLYALTVADFQYEAETWRAVLLVGAAVLWLVALPAFAGAAASRDERMRRVDGRILLRIVGAVLYGAVLFGGLALALGAIDVLFELELDEEIYLHVWGWIAFVLIPWIVIGGLADYVRPIEQTNEVAGVAHRIAMYLVPPLLALYYLILYAYVVRIFVTGEIPKNLVSPLVLAAGGLTALGVLVFAPRPGDTGVFRWLRLAPALFLPLAPLGAWALVVRIQQYGWTEFRVMRIAILAALAILAVGATVLLVRRRAFTLHLIPVGIAAVLLLGAVGPWSAIAMSRRSQESRLEAALTRVGIAPADTASAAARAVPADTAERVVPAADYEQILGSAQYLVGHFGPDALPPILRKIDVETQARWTNYAAALGLRPDAPLDGDQRGMGASLPRSTPFDVEAGTAYRVTSRSAPRENGEQGAYAMLVDSTQLVLRLPGNVLYADIGPLVGNLRGHMGRSADGNLTAEDAVLPVRDSSGVVQGQLVVWHLWLDADTTGRRLGNLEGLVVVH